jgi:hypothetical protein
MPRQMRERAALFLQALLPLSQLPIFGRHGAQRSPRDLVGRERRLLIAEQLELLENDQSLDQRQPLEINATIREKCRLGKLLM